MQLTNKWNYKNYRKEREFEEGMNHLQKDIDSLESERINLREHLKTYSSKKGETKQPVTFGNFVVYTICFLLVSKTLIIYFGVISCLAETTSNSPLVAHELTLLKKALHDERSERMRIQAADMEKILKNLTPVNVPQPKDNRISELEKDLIQVKHVSIHRACRFISINPFF